MRGKCMILAVISLTGLLAASPAWAGCKTRDLAGEYQIYVGIFEGGGGWDRCTIVIRNNGTVKNVGTCQEEDGFTYNVTGGFFTVTNSCVVTCSIETSELTFVIDHSRFDLSRNASFADDRGNCRTAGPGALRAGDAPMPG